MAAIAGSLCAAVANVPDRNGRPWAPSLRGKNSYQDPTSARRRSTRSGHGPQEVTSTRSGSVVKAASTSGSNAAANRASGDKAVSRTLRDISSMRALGRTAAISSRRSAPSSNSNAISNPAGTLMPARCAQVPQRSSQASMVKLHIPSPSGRTCVPHTSTPLLRGVMRWRARSSPVGSCRTRVTPSASWPSRKAVARIGTCSWTTALAGRRPDSTVGDTSVIAKRPVKTAGTLLSHGSVRSADGFGRSRGSFDGAGGAFCDARPAMEPAYWRHPSRDPSIGNHRKRPAIAGVGCSVP